VSVDGIGEHGEAVNTADSFLDAFAPQHVTHGGACLDDAKRYAALGQFRLEGKEHTGAGHINVR
jgi:hypothetical protein